ncbi:MAG: BadF/BadG/BcrA/BcrD ATPase family protein [Sulfitobacter sp.]
MTYPNPALIAVDGGGTGCRVAVGTAQDGVLAEATGGPANVSTNFDASVANIIAAVQTAAHAAGWSADTLAQAVAHLGLAGADLEKVQRKTAASLPFGSTRVSGDRQTTVAGVLGDQDGYVVALGTGTIIARQRAGVVSTVSGWGFQLSDQASGAWLGRALLSRVLDADEGLEPHSALTRAICVSLDGVQGVFDFSTTATPRDYARFAPEIFAAGTKGDVIAIDILHAGARYLERGLGALGFAPGDVLSLAGGVGPHFAPYLQETFKTNLQPPRGNALEGAFTLARQLARTLPACN